MRVVVAREAQEAQRWAQALRERGFDAHAFEGMHVEPTLTESEAAVLLARLPEVRAIMAVSANAARAFWSLVLKTNRSDAHSKWAFDATTSIANAGQHWCTGPGTVAALVALGVSRERITAPAPDARQDSESLWQAVLPQIAAMPAAAHVWLLRGQDADGNTGRAWFADQLRARGLRCEEHVVYRRRVPNLTAQQCDWVRSSFAQGDTWVFANGQVLSHVIAQANPSAEALARVRVRSTHPRIAELASAHGIAQVDAGDIGHSVQAWAASLESSA